MLVPETACFEDNLNHITLRNAVPEDWPAILELHRAHQQAQATNYELPYLFSPEIVMALVGVDQDGKVRNCVYIERIAELRFVGTDPKATFYARREAEGLTYALKRMGFRWIECFVPRKLKKNIEKPLRLAGFTCVDHELAHFTKDLRGEL